MRLLVYYILLPPVCIIWAVCATLLAIGDFAKKVADFAEIVGDYFDNEMQELHPKKGK